MNETNKKPNSETKLSDASADSSANSSVYKIITCIISNTRLNCGWHRHKRWYQKKTVGESREARNATLCDCFHYNLPCILTLCAIQQILGLFVIIKTFYSFHWPGSWQVLSTAVTPQDNSKTWQPVSVLTALDQGYRFDNWFVLFSPCYNGATATHEPVELQNSYTELPNSETSEVPGQWYNPQIRLPRPWLTHISGGCARYGVKVGLWLKGEIRRNCKKTFPNVTLSNTNLTSAKAQEADIPR